MPVTRSATGEHRLLTTLRLLMAFLVIVSAGVLLPPRADAAEGTVFSDGFESGTLSGYRQGAHSGVQQSPGHKCAWAWRATKPHGIPSYAHHSFPPGQPQGRVTPHVYVVRP